jgi:hypothetical protein
MARLSIEDTQRALAKLESPDAFSRTASNEGRRLQKIDGGWLVLNHGMYRDRERVERRREYMRELMANKRKVLAANEANEVITTANPSASVSGIALNTADFDTFWKAYPRKIGKGAALASWKKQKPPLEKALATVVAFSKCEQWKREGGKYIPHPATWINQGRWDDVLPVAVTAPRNYI